MKFMPLFSKFVCISVCVSTMYQWDSSSNCDG